MSVSLNFAEGSLKDYVIMVSYLCWPAPCSLLTFRKEGESSGKSPSRMVTFTFLATMSSSSLSATKLPATRERTLRLGFHRQSWGIPWIWATGLSLRSTTKIMKPKMYFPSLSSKRVFTGILLRSVWTTTDFWMDFTRTSRVGQKMQGPATMTTMWRSCLHCHPRTPGLDRRASVLSVKKWLPPVIWTDTSSSTIVLAESITKQLNLPGDRVSRLSVSSVGKASPRVLSPSTSGRFIRASGAGSATLPSPSDIALEVTRWSAARNRQLNDN